MESVLKSGRYNSVRFSFPPRHHQTFFRLLRHDNGLYYRRLKNALFQSVSQESNILLIILAFKQKARHY